MTKQLRLFAGSLKRFMRDCLGGLVEWAVILLSTLKLNDLVDYLVMKAATVASEQRTLRIDLEQRRLLPQTLHPDARQLIVFLTPTHTPGRLSVTGGVLSIFLLAEASAEATAATHAQVCVCSFPGHPLVVKPDWFSSNSTIFRIEMLRRYFTHLESVLIHIPEHLSGAFLDALPKEDLDWLRGLNEFHINIVNANNLMMPPPETLTPLKAIAKKLTITTAHRKYCTPELREKYGVPVHHFSAAVRRYKFLKFEDKEDLLIYSPDPNPYREAVLHELRQIPRLRCQEIRNMTFETYLDTISRAKWALTFGEGLDGYFIEPILSGSVSFAVYNTDFFTPEYAELQTVYPTWTELNDRIVADMERLNNVTPFEEYQARQFKIAKANYNDDDFRANIEKYYRGDYTFP